MKQAVLLLKRRASKRPGQFRPKSDQEGLIYRGMGYLSGQPTKLSGDFGRKKCRDPEYDTANALVEFALLRSDGEQIYNSLIRRRKQINEAFGGSLLWLRNARSPEHPF